MRKRAKDIAMIFVFVTVICGLMLANTLAPDKALSASERRKLAAAPEFSAENLFNGKFFAELEKYFLDQFVLRDSFRSAKAAFSVYALGRRDNNGLYILDGSIYKLEYPLDETSVKNAAAKLNVVYARYLEGKNVYYAVIPDKNFFTAAQAGYPAIDYGRMLEIMRQDVENMSYIDLFGALTAGDYYRADIHWRQERILGAADRLLQAMGADAPRPAYDARELYPFYGSFYGQAALPAPPETLVYLTDPQIESAIVYDFESGEYGRVYDPELFLGMDPYDVFLSGARALQTIENPAVDSGRELILFRDSFGSSIAPLLLRGYSKITLVDLRYISTRLLGDYIDFSRGQDVLFLYNAQILNNSAMLK